MQRGWERSADRREIDTATIERLIRPIAADARVVQYSVLSGGLGNTNLLVEAEPLASPVVLRLYTRDPSACRREESVLALVRTTDSTCPVPETLYCDPDSSVLDGVPYAITTYLPGELLQDVLERATSAERHDLGASIGRALACLSRFTFDACGSLRSDLTLDQVWGPPHELIPREVHSALYGGRAGTRLDAATRDRIWSLIETESERLTPLASLNVLVHGDFKPANLLVRRGEEGRWQVSGVLDWEFACAGHPLFDIATLLRGLDLQGDPFSSAAVAELQEEAGGDVPEDWRAVIRLLDVCALCQLLDRSQDRPQVNEDVRSLLQHLLVDWPILRNGSQVR
jgi:aminoglycoside phosphotransferase (APT) family kinase protein